MRIPHTMTDLIYEGHNRNNSDSALVGGDVITHAL